MIFYDTDFIKLKVKSSIFPEKGSLAAFLAFTRVIVSIEFFQQLQPAKGLGRNLICVQK